MDKRNLYALKNILYDLIHVKVVLVFRNVSFFKSYAFKKNMMHFICYSLWVHARI